MLSNFHHLARVVHEPTLIGGLVTMIANVIRLRQQLMNLVPQGRFQPMNINLCFDRGIIGNLGPGNFELLIINQLMPLFTLPDPRTNIHDIYNWLYDWGTSHILPSPTPETPLIYDHLDDFLPDEDIDPETPLFYHDFPPPEQIGSNFFDSLVVSPPTVFHPAPALTAIQSEIDLLKDELVILQIDFHSFMDTVVEQLDYIYQHLFYVSLDRRG